MQDVEGPCGLTSLYEFVDRLCEVAVALIPFSRTKM